MLVGSLGDEVGEFAGGAGEARDEVVVHPGIVRDREARLELLVSR